MSATNPATVLRLGAELTILGDVYNFLSPGTRVEVEGRNWSFDTLTGYLVVDELRRHSLVRVDQVGEVTDHESGACLHCEGPCAEDVYYCESCTHPVAAPKAGTVQNNCRELVSGATAGDYPLLASCAHCGHTVKCADATASWYHLTSEQVKCASWWNA